MESKVKSIWADLYPLILSVLCIISGAVIWYFSLNKDTKDLLSIAIGIAGSVLFLVISEFITWHIAMKKQTIAIIDSINKMENLEYHETWNAEKLRKMIAEAKRQVKILHTWFPDEGDLVQWKFSANPKPKLEVFIASEKNPAMIERARFRPEFQKTETLQAQVQSKVEESKRMLEAMFKRCEIKGEVNYYVKGMPSGPIYLIDDKVVFGIYPPHISSNAAPMFCVPATSNPGRLICESFEVLANPERTRSLWSKVLNRRP